MMVTLTQRLLVQTGNSVLSVKFEEAAIENKQKNHTSTEKMVTEKGKLLEQFTVGSLTLIQSGTSPAPSLILSTEVSNDRTATVPRERQKHSLGTQASPVLRVHMT